MLIIQNHRDEPNDDITNFKSFKFKVVLTRKTPANVNIKNIN